MRTNSWLAKDAELMFNHGLVMIELITANQLTERLKTSKLLNLKVNFLFGFAMSSFNLVDEAIKTHNSENTLSFT